MIVSRENFQAVLTELKAYPKLAVDCETTGLRVWHDDFLFSIIVGVRDRAWYFNFWDYGTGEEGFHENLLLPREWIKALQPIFDDPSRIICMHNAKFDMGMLHREGLYFNCVIHCTQAQARVEHNDHLGYDLAECADRIGEKKDDKVMEYITEHHLWKWDPQPGKKSRSKRMFFQQVPFKIIVPYGEQDAITTYRLMEFQEKAIEEKDNLANNKAARPLKGVMEMERRLTRTCFSMERRGVLIDVDYCKRAIDYEETRYREAAKKFQELTGLEFVDSGKALAEAFVKMGETYPTTSKGNPSFTDEVLADFDSPVAKCIQEYRDAYKRCNTYFRSFLHFADPNNFIHPNMRQGGTATGRFSYSEPNFQNLTKDEDAANPFPIRRAVIPPEDFVMVSIDYDQQEFRMMLDYAGQYDLIEKIMGGYDPHQATADLVGCERRPAKVLNFGLLYGMGLAKLARQLLPLTSEQKLALKKYEELKNDQKRDYDAILETNDVLLIKEPLEKMRAFKQKYFGALPKVEKFIWNATETAERRGFVFTWMGRRIRLPHAFAYKAANGIIQGGCADVAKVAMNRIDDFLAYKRSYQAIQVHDEILFMVHKNEISLVPELVKIMSEVYPYRHIPLTCSPSYSLKSWGDMTEGEFGKEAGDEVQGERDRPVLSGTA